MAKVTEKPIVAGLLLFFFIGLVAVAVQFMQTPFTQTSEPPKPEGFASAAPTRATDCSCLPGYVPSNKKSDSQYGGIIFDMGESDIVYFVPDNEKSFYFTPNESCGINFRSPSNPPKTYWQLVNIFGPNWWVGRQWKGRAPCEIIKKSDTSNNFFCQSLSNTKDIKQCY